MEQDGKPTPSEVLLTPRELFSRKCEYNLISLQSITINMIASQGYAFMLRTKFLRLCDHIDYKISVPVLIFLNKYCVEQNV